MIRPSKKARGKRTQVVEADGLVKKLVHDRDQHRCLKCGKESSLQAAHIRSKGVYQRLRFELLNVITLCLRCHIFWAHRDPVGFVEWVDSVFPGRMQMLREMAATAAKIDMQELLIGLRLEVSKL